MNIHCAITLNSVICVPSYSNNLVINTNVAYIPYGWTHSILVTIKRIQGQGPFRNVSLEYSIPSGEHSEVRIEQGILIFQLNATNDQPLHYHPAHLYIMTRAIGRFFGRLHWKIWAQE